jgi:hypothetical protein
LTPLPCQSLLGQLKADKVSAPGGNVAGQDTGSSTLQGETYRLNEWPTKRPNYRHQRIIWYKVVAVDSKSQPLIFEPLSCNDEPKDWEQSNPVKFEGTDFAGCDSEEAEAFLAAHFPSIPNRDKNPLVDGERLVIGVYDPGGQLELHNVLLLNINVTAPSAGPINPAPLRPTISAGAPSGPSAAGAPGLGEMKDQEKASFINMCSNPAIISAVGSTSQFKPFPEPFDPLSVKVTDATNKPLQSCPVEFMGLPDGKSTRVFTDKNGIAKVTTDLKPSTPGHFTVNATITRLEGVSLKNGVPTFKGNPVFKLLSAKTQVAYYLPWINRLSGDTIPTVTITAVLGPLPTMSGNADDADSQKPDGQGAGPTPGNPSPEGGPPSEDCSKGRADAKAKDCCCAVAVAKAIAQQLTSAGGNQDNQAQEKSLTLLNASYAQVHNLYTYNIATGLIYSFLRNQTYSRVETAPPSGCTTGSASSCVSPELYATVANPTSPTIAPALFFTVYVLGSSDAPRKWGFLGRFDAERKWALSDLAPQPSVGFSLSSPSTDFFEGFSSEVWRGVQIVYGVHTGKVTYLAPTYTNDPTSSAAPITSTHFRNKFFFGVTFNITFIQTLFGGGKGGGG